MRVLEEQASRRVSSAISRTLKRFFYLELWKEENTKLCIVHSGAKCIKSNLNRESSIATLAMWPPKKYALR